MDCREQLVLDNIASREQATSLVRIYRGMADRIESRGWVQHAPIGPNLEICVTQALTEAAAALAASPWFYFQRSFRADYRFNPLLPLAHHVLVAWIGGYQPAIWNDQPERTAEEVIKTLRDLADMIDSAYGNPNAAGGTKAAER